MITNLPVIPQMLQIQHFECIFLPNRYYFLGLHQQRGYIFNYLNYAGFDNLCGLLITQLIDAFLLIGHVPHVLHYLFQQFLFGITHDLKKCVKSLFQRGIHYKFVALVHVRIDLLGEHRKVIQSLVHF